MVKKKGVKCFYAKGIKKFRCCNKNNYDGEYPICKNPYDTKCKNFKPKFEWEKRR